MHIGLFWMELALEEEPLINQRKKPRKKIT